MPPLKERCYKKHLSKPSKIDKKKPGENKAEAGKLSLFSPLDRLLDSPKKIFLLWREQ